MDSFQKRIVRLWYAYTFFMAYIMDGLPVVVSVYLVAYAGVSPGDAGLIWFTRDISMMVFQIPMGAFVDYTTHKKAFLILFTLLSTLVPMIIVFTQNVPILLAKSVVEGMATTSLRVFKGPFTLGIAGHENFEKAASHTEFFEHSGSLVAIVIAGLIGYLLYPNVLPIFYVLGAFGTLSTLALLFMTPEKFDRRDSSPGKSKKRNFINDDWARNNIVVPDDMDSNSNSTPSEDVEEDEDLACDAEDKRDNSSLSLWTSNVEQESPDNTKKSQETLETDLEQQTQPPPTPSSRASPPAPDSVSLWTIFVEQKAMSYFALSIFFFHLGNAAVLPILGQVLALDNGKAGIPYTAVNIALAQLSSFGGIYMIDWFVKKDYKINLPIMVGFGALIPRIIIIVVVLRYSRNPYVLMATQLFDGLSAGVNGLAIMRVTKTLTEATNRFGIVFSIVTISWSIGAALSNLITGYLIDAFGYEAGFLFLLAAAPVSVWLVYLTKVESPAGSTPIVNNNNGSDNSVDKEQCANDSSSTEEANDSSSTEEDSLSTSLKMTMASFSSRRMAILATIKHLRSQIALVETSDEKDSLRASIRVQVSYLSKLNEEELKSRLECDHNGLASPMEDIVEEDSDEECL